MRTSYFPSTDLGLLGWTKNLSDRLVESPEPYGIAPETAAAFAALQAAFADAMLAVDPGVRNKASVAAKNDLREAIKASARLIRSIVFGQATVTDEQKIQLGFNVPRAKTSIPAPETAPAVSVSSTDGHTVKLRLSDSTTLARSRPPGATSANIFRFIGDEPSDDLSKWTLALSTTRRFARIILPASVPPGTRVWFCAYWTNPRSQPGPMSRPAGAWIQFGGSMVLANLDRTTTAAAA